MRPLLRPLFLREDDASRLLYAAGVATVAPTCPRCGEACGDCDDDAARLADEPRQVADYESAHRAGRL